MEEPVVLEATARPLPPYQVPARVSEVYQHRTPRSYAAAQPGRDPYPSRPPPVHDKASDAGSWSRQTQDALDAYRRMGGEEEQRQQQQQQQQRQRGGPAAGRGGVPRGPGPDSSPARGLEEEEEEEEHVLLAGALGDAGYRLDRGRGGGAPGGPSRRAPETSHAPEGPALGYLAGCAEAGGQLGEEREAAAAAHEPVFGQAPPGNHRMTRMMVEEDIGFFTALLEGHDPPGGSKETEDLVRDEMETRRHGREVREQEADKRRHEEAEAAKADTDFFMMLMMQQE